MKKTCLFILFIFAGFFAIAENGYQLWLRYDMLKNEQQRNNYIKTIQGIYAEGSSATFTAIRDELTKGLSGLL